MKFRYLELLWQKIDFHCFSLYFKKIIFLDVCTFYVPYDHYPNPGAYFLSSIGWGRVVTTFCKLMSDMLKNALVKGVLYHLYQISMFCALLSQSYQHLLEK